MAIHDLDRLLAELEPRLHDQQLVFCTLVDADLGQAAELGAFATIREDEGLAVVISQERAVAAGLLYEGIFQRITLEVPSSLLAVGLTAVVADRLMKLGISANVIAGTCHDHVLVPADRALEALVALRELSR